MASSYTSLLGLALPVTGELSGSWGDIVNDSITSLLDSAISGTTSLTTDADVTLTTTDGVANEARQAIILWNPASGTVTRNITAPAQSKIYTVINASGGTQSIVFRGAGPTTGVTIIKGESAVVAWNGTDFIKISNTGGGGSFTNVTISGTTTLSGLTASTALALNASKEVVSVTNTGTGNNVLSASPTLTGTVAGASLQLSSLTATRVTYAGASGLLTDSANLTFNGTDLTVSGAVNAGTINATTLDLTNLEVTNIKAKDGTAGMQIADSTGVVSFTANPVMSGGTANGVAYLNGSKALTTGSALTFDGSTLGVNYTSASNYKFYVSRGGTAGELAAFTDGTAQTLTIDTAASSILLNSANGGALAFGVTTEQMRLTSTGLGIGNSSPTAKLDVTGTAAISGAVTLSGGTANGVSYLNASKVLTTGSALTFDGTALGAARAIFTAADSAYAVAFNATTGNARISGYDSTYGSTALVAYSAGYAGYGPLSVDALNHRWLVSGSEQMRLTSTGLGLGTSSPASKLVVSNAGALGIEFDPASGGMQVYNRSTSAYGTMNLSANTMYFRTGASPAINMTLNASGNVGIGTSSPTAVLDVRGAAYVIGLSGTRTTDTANGNGFEVVPGATNNVLSFNRTSSAYLPIRWRAGVQSWEVDNIERMRIDSSGNVGIGTISPADKLDVVGNARVRDALVMQRSSSSLYLSVLNYGDSLGGAKTDNLSFGLLGGGNLIFWSNGTERMRLSDSGNLGIGTSSPQSRLHIATGGVINQVTGTAGQNAAFEFAGNGNTVSLTGYLVGQAANGDAYVFQRAANPLILGTNNLERLRIDSSGRVGINTSSPTCLLYVASTANPTTIPALGAASNHFAVGNTTAYGTMFGSLNTGVGYIQQQRFDGTATAYNLLLQPNGGNVGIGTTAPNGIIHASTTGRADLRLQSTGASNAQFIYQTSIGTASLNYGTGSTSNFSINIDSSERLRIDSSGTLILKGPTDNGLQFWEAGVAEGCRIGMSSGSLRFLVGSTTTPRVTIDSSGNLLVGATSTTLGQTGIVMQPAIGGQVAYITLGHADGTTSGNGYLGFGYNGSLIGSITQNGTTAVAYNTSSDYRLKENIAPMTGALAKVAALKPVTYTWKTDGSAGEGFIAHELAEVCPAAVTGEKDAVDADGNPQYQGIDVSFLVGTLTAAIQEQQAIIESLKARLDAANL